MWNPNLILQYKGKILKMFVIAGIVYLDLGFISREQSGVRMD